MTQQNSDVAAPAKGWLFTPDLPLRLAPYYDRPLNFVAVLKYFARSWHPKGTQLPFLVLAIAIWAFASPTLEQAQSFEFGWVFSIWLRNFLLLLLVAGGLHLYLFTLKGQGDALKYDKRSLGKGEQFLFGDQTRDNMFLSLTGAVFFWTGYEALMWWAYANGIAPYITFADSPVWFIVLIALIPLWEAMFFYWQHRLLHWPPLYKHIHAWHHRNVATGPWSGLAMHPGEQLVLMSDTLIYLVVPAHPVHVIYNLLFHGVGAPTSHAGFDRVQFGKFYELRIGDFFHQLHHRYFDCNMGTLETPWDGPAGTFHNGSADGDLKIKEIRRKKYGNKGPAD